jgi:hypothetical protein
MFPIWKLFLHKQIQTYYQHIIFNVRKKTTILEVQKFLPKPYNH